MYRCMECGNLFEEGEQKTYREYMGECHGYPAYEEFCGCPLCGGSYKEITPCEICGTYNHDFGEEYCEECKKEVKERFRKLVRDNFTEEERELLNDLYEEEYI